MRIIVFWVTMALVMLVDQATKAAVRVASPETGRIATLVPGLIDIVHVENTGAAFSLGAGAGVSMLFVVVALVVTFVAFALVIREDLPMLLVLSLACVAGGGMGNMVDRLVQGSVTDFIAITFVRFPVFNVADIFVTCGIAASFAGYVVWERRQEHGAEIQGDSGPDCA